MAAAKGRGIKKRKGEKTVKVAKSDRESRTDTGEG